MKLPWDPRITCILTLAFYVFGAYSQTNTPSWYQYVRAPNDTLVYPSKVVSTENNVTNPSALLSPSNSSVTMLYRAPNTTNSSAPTIVLDFGRNIVGFPILSFTGASDNSPGIRMAFSETLEYLGNRSDFTRSDNGLSITSGTDQHAVPTDPSIWTSAYGCEAGGKVCSDGLHGFRYLKIWLDALDSDAPLTSPSGFINIQSIALNFTAFLGTPNTYTGYFESSDSDLNQYWFDASYTNELCTDIFTANTTDPREAYSPSLDGKLVLFDGAKRDRDPYVGDLAVSAKTLYLTHPQTSVAVRNVLADLADHQRADGWIPPASIRSYTLPLFDYPLWWVSCSYDYVLYTGDVAYLEDYFSVLVKVLDSYYPSVTDNTTGLLSKGDTTGTGSYGDYAFLPRDGLVTYYNALYVKALREAAHLAIWLNTSAATGTADDWNTRADKVAAALSANLWDSGVGAYKDSTTGAVRHAQDGNALAILSGAANASFASSALSYLSKNNARPYGNAFFDTDALGAGFSQRVYAFISYFEISARFETRQQDSAIDQIMRMYGFMAGKDPGVTMWEGIGENGSYYEEGFTSLAHGWSTGVLPALSNYVLGVIPTGPGFSTWLLRPVVPNGVSWARGVVPTPNSREISASWTLENGVFELSVAGPDGSRGTVSVPAQENSTVSVNGTVAWLRGSSQGYGASFADGSVSLGVDGGMAYEVKVT